MEFESPNGEISLERLFRDYAGMLASLARDLTDSSEDAEDVFQQLWVRAKEHWPTLRVHDCPSAWLVTVLRHLCVDLARKNRHRRARSLSTEVGEMPTGADRDESELAIGQVEKRILRHALGLPGLQGDILRAILEENTLDPSRIASALGHGVGAVRTTMYRTRKSLLKLYCWGEYVNSALAWGVTAKDFRVSEHKLYQDLLTDDDLTAYWWQRLFIIGSMLQDLRDRQVTSQDALPRPNTIVNLFGAELAAQAALSLSVYDPHELAFYLAEDWLIEAVHLANSNPTLVSEQHRSRLKALLSTFKAAQTECPSGDCDAKFAQVIFSACPGDPHHLPAPMAELLLPWALFR